MIDAEKIEQGREIIKRNPYLAWDVADINNLSINSILERVLNYADWNEVMELFNIIGIKEASNIFYNRIKETNRSNYLPKIEHYFDLFFKKYA